MSVRDDCERLFTAGLRRYGTISRMAAAIGAPRATLGRWMNESQHPRFEELCRMCDVLGYRLVPADVLRDCSQDSDFISLPVVRKDARLLPGTIPPDEITGWCRVERRAPSVEGLGDGVVFRVDDSFNAKDGIPEGSAVLVDRSDVEVRDFHLYLVRSGDAGLMLRRVVDSDAGYLWCDADGRMGVRHGNGFRVIGRAVWARTEIRHL